MKSIKIAGGVALFLGVMCFTLVTRTPLASLQSRMPNLLQDTEKFQGNIINGSVKDLGTVNGPIDLKWGLSPMKLLTGKLGGDVEFDWLQASGNGQVALSPSKTLFISDTIATSPASLIETFLPFVRFGGKLRLDLKDGTASETEYGPFTGEFTWNAATVSISEQAKLGDITLNMSEQDGGTRGVLSSKDGDIVLSGTIDLQPDGNYTLDLNARAQPSASSMVVNTLAQVAQKQSDGSFRLQQSGQLAELM